MAEAEKVMKEILSEEDNDYIEYIAIYSAYEYDSTIELEKELKRVNYV